MALVSRNCGIFRSYRLSTSFVSTRLWVQTSLGPRIDHRCATVILYYDIFPSPLCASLYSILSFSVLTTAFFSFVPFTLLGIPFADYCNVIGYVFSP